MSDRKPVDWEAVEREYRAGLLSVREIGKAACVSHVAVLKRAKREGWVQNLAARVREEVTARLVTADVTASNSREVVSAVAIRTVDIVIRHRADISRLINVVGGLIADLEADAKLDPSERMSIKDRAVIVESLTRSQERMVKLERQAFGVDDGSTPDDPATKGDLKSALAKLDHGQRDQLRRLAEAVAG